MVMLFGTAGQASTLETCRESGALSDAAEACKQVLETSDLSEHAKAEIYYNLGVIALGEANNTMNNYYFSRQQGQKVDLEGYVQRRENFLDQAVEEFSKAIELQPDNRDAIIAHAGACALKEDWQCAADGFRNAIRLNHDVVRLLNSRGTALFMLGLHNEALDDFGEAIRREPEEPDAYINRALVLERVGRTAGAVQSLRKAIDLGASRNLDKDLERMTSGPAATEGDPMRNNIEVTFRAVVTRGSVVVLGLGLR